MGTKRKETLARPAWSSSAAYTAIAILIILLISSPISNAATGVGVYNSPPTFVNIAIIDHVDRISIDVAISDYNGWDDIAAVNVRIVDARNRVISNLTYRQYDSYGARIDSFTESEGNYLISPDPEKPYITSYVQRFNGVGWFQDNTTQRMVFMIRPLNGAFVNITAYDMDGEVCVFEGPFSAEYSEPPAINVTLAVGISLIAAAGSSSYILYGRQSSNKLARRVEKILSQIHEE